ncbi:hypothetical protein Scep_024907 [Stephania cephalantha]|uniref:Nuclear transcription factor Y subunit n=1 Tax=Stephania cephalantha TaxID=152367 RepID=A0AAP0F2Y1_9MAGN
MNSISKKESDRSSTHSDVPCVFSCQSWWSSTPAQVPQSTLSKSGSLSIDSVHHQCNNLKQFGILQDQDSCSTQSTGQSHREVVSMGACNSGQCISAHSGYSETSDQQVGNIQSVLSLGISEVSLPASQIGYNPSLVHISYPYDPYLGGFLAACAPQAIIHPQMVGMATARVPLPLNVADNEPIYVNAKQYRGILRRREHRAKLEAQNQPVQSRKPYLHESRHIHAMKRVRGAGGRFLNTKMQQTGPTDTTSSMNSSDSDPLRLGGNPSGLEVIQSDTSYTTMGASTTSSSDITSVSNIALRQPDPRFSSYPSLMGGAASQGGGAHIYNGSHHHVHVIQ